MSNSESTSYRIEILAGTANYHTCALYFRSRLEELDLDRFLTSHPYPLSKNEQAPHKKAFRQTETHSWRHLAVEFAPTKHAVQLHAHHQFLTLTFDAHETLPDFVSKLEMLLLEWRRSSDKLEDDSIIQTILSSLSDQYKPLVYHFKS
ncbi:hypothetical protein ROZALSC1DRAFT_24330 [Rozella allomycis CSF55]|uniref:Uncharacterized protein n=1 Tax=Rozella allomycis (strain CSF55) TaxID=988480 RepID=A0A4P9YG73_ROZAC|nr:hypothetical protein ROZALSC1DRAFT_24330 [Rozella allomycis CSF55]